MARKKTIKNPLSEADKELFAELMYKWRGILNLMDWRYVMDDKPSTEMAEIVEQETEHRLVRWRVGTDFGNTKVTPESLEGVAIHENLHVLLHALVECAINEGEFNSATLGEEHRVIATLENLLLLLARFMELEKRAASMHVTLETLVSAMEDGIVEPPQQPTA